MKFVIVVKESIVVKHTKQIAFSNLLMIMSTKPLVPLLLQVWLLSSLLVITKSWWLKNHSRWVFRKNSIEFSIGFDYLLILLLQVVVLYYYTITCPFQNILWSHDLIMWYGYLIPMLFISCSCCMIWYWRSNVQTRRKLFPLWGSHNTPTHSLPPKPQLKARAPKLANWLSEQCPSQIGPICGLLAYAQDRVLKLYHEHLAKKFSDPTLVEASASKITEPFSKAPPPQVQNGLSKMDVDLPSVLNTSILGESANADDVVSLGSPKDWGLNNQISGCDLYVHSSTVFSHSLTILAQSLATYANVIAATRNFVASSSVVCVAQCDNIVIDRQ